MLISPQLQDFIEDAIARQQALSDVRHAMQSWKNSKIGRKQNQYIMKAGDSSTAQNCINHLKPLFDDLSWLYDMLTEFCNIQSNNSFANIELRSSKSKIMQTIILHQERKFSITLGLAKAQNSVNESFLFGPDMMMLSSIGAAHIIKARLDKNENLLNPEMLTSLDGELHIYDNRREAINLIASKRDIIFLRITIKTKAFETIAQDISHHYFQYNGDNSPAKQLADETLSRAQFIFSILRHQQCKKAIPLFEQWVRNDTPDMRWYVMREFLALDMQAALPDLMVMARYDDNRDVRKAALDTWHILKSQYPEAFQELRPS